MNFSKDDLIAFQEENDRVFNELNKSNSLDSVEAVTTGFLNRLSTSFDHFVKEKRVSVDCEESCSFCCQYNRVEVFLVELLVISAFIKRVFNEKQIDNVKNKLLRSTPELKNPDATDNKIQNGYYRKCALLEDDRCMIYNLRPINCRHFHSIDAHLCETRYNNPSPDIFDPADIKLKRRMHALIAGFEDAFIKSGFEMVRYELNQSLLALLDDPMFMEDWYSARAT